MLLIQKHLPPNLFESKGFFVYPAKEKQKFRVRLLIFTTVILSYIQIKDRHLSICVILQSLPENWDVDLNMYPD